MSSYVLLKSRAWVSQVPQDWSGSHREGRGGKTVPEAEEGEGACAGECAWNQEK